MSPMLCLGGLDNQRCPVRNLRLGDSSLLIERDEKVVVLAMCY